MAKLDRLSRNQSFLMSVYEGTGDGGVVFCDLPTIPAGPVGKFIVQQMAAVAEPELGLISQRTKAALAASKARGKKLGGYRGGPVVDGTKGTGALQKAADDFAASVSPMVREMLQNGLTLRQIAGKLGSGRHSDGTRWPVDGNGRQERPGPGSMSGSSSALLQAARL